MSIVSSSQKILFSGLNVTATTDYVYNDNASTGISVGWQTAKSTDCVIQIGAATLTNPIQYRIEGRFSNSDRAASISAGSVSGASIDTLVAVDALKTAEIRVGVKVATVAASPTGDTHNFYCRLLLTDRR